MENKKTTVLLFVILSLVAVTLAYAFITGTIKTTSADGAIIAGTEQAADSITVYGQGKVYIEPDIAYVVFGYENLDPDPKKAQDANAMQMDRIINAVKSSGIDDADIQTSQYNVYQQYRYFNDTKELEGYRVTNTIRVTVRAVSKAGDIIKVAYDAGSNLFSGITFDIIKRQEAYLEALGSAMDRAEEKAKKMAQDSGRSITGVINIVESSTSSSPYYSPFSNYAVAESASMAAYNGNSISSGELEIKGCGHSNIQAELIYKNKNS